MLGAQTEITSEQGSTSQRLGPINGRIIVQPSCCRSLAFGGAGEKYSRNIALRCEYSDKRSRAVQRGVSSERVDDGVSESRGACGGRD
jgi:hypothetical protein